jgi:hypothetical protein
LSSISLLKNSPQINVFEEILANAAVLTSYENAMMDPSISSKIEDSYPNIAKEQIFFPDKVKEAISTTGKFLSSAFTVIGGYMKVGIEKAGSYINEKI